MPPAPDDLRRHRFEQMTSAPPQVLWEFVTTPGRRVGWQAGVTGVEVIAPGNRRGGGTTNHCVHGGKASVEHLLDWRPYDYLTIRNTVPTPLGELHFLQTTELEPRDGGTALHLRMGPADAPRAHGCEADDAPARTGPASKR